MTSRKSILIVEDDTDLREALVQILRDEGYEADGAVHGEEALAHLRSRAASPCLILLDLTMPVMNGWQFRAEQRRDPELSGIPVVVLSAGSNLSVQIADLQVRDYVSKPICLPDLLDKIQRYCGLGEPP